MKTSTIYPHFRSILIKSVPKLRLEVAGDSFPRFGVGSIERVKAFIPDFVMYEKVGVPCGGFDVNDELPGWVRSVPIHQM